jgi:Tfp pilus assembly protein PilX
MGEAFMQRLTRINQQRGMITLVIALMLLLIISMITLMVAKSVMTEQKISANEFDSRQASTAAQAGLQYAIPYLAANAATILKDTNSDGYIDSYSDSNTSNVSLNNNGGSYTITYSNPTQNNFNLIQIQVVGKSADGLITRTVTELVNGYNNILPHPGSVGLVSQSLVTLSGSVAVTNTVTNQTIDAGGLINSNGNVSMTTSSGSTNNPSSSTSGATMNNTTLANATNAQLFQNFFGTTMTAVQNEADLVYSCSSCDYSTTLNGVVGKIIYINGNANFSTNTVIGSASQPVILVATGTISMSGGVTFYGFMYGAQGVNISGTVNFYGVAAGAANFNVSGHVSVVYDKNVINNLKSNWESFAPVAGSWHDF